MSAYLQQEVDFILRTKQILDQYDEFFTDKSKDEKYEVTLLINSFVGLLILPQQQWFEYLPNESINKDDWGIDPKDIKFISPKESITLKHIARHLRNSIAHYNFRVFNNVKNEINHIRFEDYTSPSKDIITFEATITIADLKIFLSKFSSVMTEIMVESI